MDTYIFFKKTKRGGLENRYGLRHGHRHGHGHGYRYGQGISGNVIATECGQEVWPPPVPILVNYSFSIYKNVYIYVYI